MGGRHWARWGRLRTAAASAAAASAAAISWASGTAGSSSSSASSAAGSSTAGRNTRPHKTDVLVVGGGIIGASAAYYAAKAGGARVTLLERGSIASEASSLSAGTIACDGWGRIPARVDWFGVLCNGSVAIFKELEQLGHDCELRLEGALTIARNDRELKLLQAQYESLRGNGHDVEYLSGHDAVVAVEPALAGGDIMAALHSRQAGHVNAAAATRAIADSAAALGATICVGSTAVAIEELGCRSDGGSGSTGSDNGSSSGGSGSSYKYRVRTQEGQLHDCKALIVAAGAWARPLGRCDPVSTMDDG